jgi:hypothetical protein
MNVIERATSALLAALQAAPAVAPRVDRVRADKLGSLVAAGVDLRPVKAMPLELLDGLPAMWECVIPIDCTVLVPAGTAADVAVYPLLSAVYARLVSDTTLGGEVDHIEVKNIDFDFDFAADGYARATLGVWATVPATSLFSL